MKHLLIALSIIFIFTQCAKKTTEAVQVMQKDPAQTWRATPPAPAPARDIHIGDYNSFDLANGLKVIVVENHKLPQVSYQLSFNQDAIIEGDKAGYSSFAGQLLSKGTKTMTKADIDGAIDFIGGNLTTSQNGIFASSLKKHAPTLLDIMTDVLLNPSFPQEEFDKIVNQAKSALISVKTDPNSIISNIRSVVNFGKNHPYGEVQTDKTIANITIDDCKKYYNTYFKPNNAYLVIVGDITPAEAKAQVEKYFGKWQKGSVPTFVYDKPVGPKGTQVRFGNKDGAVQSVINISYPIDFTPGNPEAIQANIMNSILGGGIFSGRLMQNLREDKAFTYGARSSLDSDKLIGSFNASASVRNEVTDSSIVEFLYEMKRMVNEPVSAEDLALAKTGMAGQFGRSLESPQTIARFALNTFRYNLPKDYYNHYLKNIDAVTIQDVQSIARKYIHPDNCNIFVVGNKDAVADKLLKFDTDGKIDYYGPFGQVVEDKKIEISSDVTGASVIADYLAAIGGVDKLKAVKTLSMTMKADMMGQQVTMEKFQTASGKVAQKMSMMGMVVQEMRYDGVKGMQSQMGQKSIITEGPEFEALKDQAVMFEQLDYLNKGYQLDLKGIEDVDGVSCYKLMVTNADGESTVDYFDVKTGLLRRTVSTQGEHTMTSDFKSYKDVGGIKIPDIIEINGMAPVPIALKAEDIQINKELSDDLFKVE